MDRPGRFQQRPPVYPVRLLDLAHHQQLPGGKAVAALYRIDQQSVGFILVDIVDEHIDAHRQRPVGVDPETVLGQRFERPVRIVPETEIIGTADLGVTRGDDNRALLVEHLPELPEVGVVGRTFHDEPVFFLAHRSIGCDRAETGCKTLIDLFTQEPVVIDRVIGAAKRTEYRADVIDAAEIGIDR